MPRSMDFCNLMGSTILLFVNIVTSLKKLNEVKEDTK